MDATYNADLREMNDLNFARFDAKVGERLTQFESRIDRRFAEFEARVDGRLADIDGRLVALEARVEGRLAALEIRLTRRVYIASTATFLAQIVALATLFRIFVAR